MVLPRRAGRRTNLGLAALLAAAAGTGVLAYGFGTDPASRVVVLAHGAAGLGLLLLVPWKSVVVGRSVRRTRAAGRPRDWGGGAALGVLVVLAVVTGTAHALGAAGPWAGVTSLQVHVGATLVAVLFLADHVLRHRQRVRRTDVGRRSLLRAGAVGVGGVVLWTALEGVSRAASLPGAVRRSTGSHERGSGVPQQMPVTQWFTDSVPRPDDAHRLAVVRGGRTELVDPETLDPVDDVRAVLDCTGGWWAEQDWSGVRLERLLAGTVGTSGGQAVDVVSVTGYRRRLPLADAGRLLLATHVGGVPLSAGHGAPVRLVAPGRRGFWWVKWVERVEVVDAPSWQQPPFPLQ